jgi:hypothetical protein
LPSLSNAQKALWHDGRFSPFACLAVPSDAPQSNRKSYQARRETDMTLPTITRAIRRRCLDCVGGSSKQVAKCPATECTLWPHRFSVNPANSRVVDKRGLYSIADLSREGLLIRENAPKLTKSDFKTLTPSIDTSSVLAPGKAIKAPCVWCQGGSASAVKDCPSGNCALNPFRFGRHPHRRNYTPKQREEARQRLKQARAKKWKTT